MISDPAQREKARQWLETHDNRGLPTRPFERTSRPAEFGPDAVLVYDWLARNGVDEWIPVPEQLAFHLTAETLTYTSFPWHVDETGQDCRGWDGEWILTEIIGDRAEAPPVARTVPLVTPMPEQVRKVLTDAGASVAGP